MTSSYTYIRDTGGFNGGALTPSDTRFNVKLTASTAITVNVPNDSNQFVAYFTVSSTDSVWVSDSGEAKVPTDKVTQNPSFAVNAFGCNKPYVFKGGTALSLITDAENMSVSVMFYKV